MQFAPSLRALLFRYQEVSCSFVQRSKGAQQRELETSHSRYCYKLVLNIKQNLVNAPSLRAQGGGLEKRIPQLFPNTQNRLLAGTSVWVANLRILVPQPQKQIQITPKVHIQSWKENGCFRFGAGWCLHASLSRDISKSFYSVSSYNCHSCHSHKSQGGWCK